MFEHLTLTLAQADDGAPVIPGDTQQPTEVQPATPATDGTTGAPNTADQAQPNPFISFLPIILIFAVFYVLMILPQRKEKKRRANMIAELTKGERVQTVGGLIGSVVEVRENEVILKVDENSNTRIHFTKAAIQSVISDNE